MPEPKASGPLGGRAAEDALGVDELLPGAGGGGERPRNARRSHGLHGEAAGGRGEGGRGKNVV